MPEEIIQTELTDLEKSVLPSLQERHFTISYGDRGFSYDSLIGPYLEGGKVIDIEDPFIRAKHQFQNFVRFCEVAVKATTIGKINLITAHNKDTDVEDLAFRFEELK